MHLSILSFVLAFALIWIVSGVLITQSQKIANILRLSPFLVSFFLLGFITSLPELSIGINSIIDSTPSIFIGNILGGISILFLLIIPLLAIVAKSVVLKKQFRGTPLILLLITVLMPFLLMLDGKTGIIDAILLLVMYITLSVLLIRKNSENRQPAKVSLNTAKKIIPAVAIIIVCVIAMMLLANIIVDRTIEFGLLLGISPMLISLFVISVATNLPELLVGIRSILAENKALAYGNYLGSATANTAVFGILSISNFIKTRQPIVADANVYTFAIIVLGLVLFYIFKRSKADISRKEGLVLVALYIIFLIGQFLLN